MNHRPAAQRGQEFPAQPDPYSGLARDPGENHPRRFYDPNARESNRGNRGLTGDWGQSPSILRSGGSATDELAEARAASRRSWRPVPYWRRPFHGQARCPVRSPRSPASGRMPEELAWAEMTDGRPPDVWSYAGSEASGRPVFPAACVFCSAWIARQAISGKSVRSCRQVERVDDTVGRVAVARSPSGARRAPVQASAGLHRPAAGSHGRADGGSGDSGAVVVPGRVRS